MGIRHYIVLIEIERPVQALRDLEMHLSKACTEPPKLLWRNPSMLGFGVRTANTVRDLLAAISPAFGKALVKDVVILELGKDWFARSETVAHGWLHVHLRFLGTDGESGTDATPN